jgi:hypothetical protein
MVTAILLCRRICIAKCGCTSSAANSEPHVLRVECRASSEATMSHIKRSLTRDHPPDVMSFLYGSRRAVGPLAPPCLARLRSRSGGANAGRLARKAEVPSGRYSPEVPGPRRILTREPSRWPRSGSCGQARSQPDRQASLRAITPCQIRHPVQLEAHPSSPVSSYA